MKKFKFTTDTNEYIIEADDQLEAEMLFTREYFPEALDDDLPDLYDVEELKEELK